MHAYEVQYRDTSRVWVNLYEWEADPDSMLFRVIRDGILVGEYNSRAAAVEVAQRLRRVTAGRDR